jgi:putative restriction endonuclease
MVAHDTRNVESARLWEALTEAMHGAFSETARAADAPISHLNIPGGLGAPTLIRPRLGQSSFRTAVLAAYERRCVVTGERTLPVLQAAHIRPFADVNEHDVRNGLLMRSDLHVLFDAGLVTVDPDLRFRVSSKIREMYENGRDYYALHDRSIRSPRSRDQRPLREHLDYHSSVIFKP